DRAGAGPRASGSRGTAPDRPAPPWSLGSFPLPMEKDTVWPAIVRKKRRFTARVNHGYQTATWDASGAAAFTRTRARSTIIRDCGRQLLKWLTHRTDWARRLMTMDELR